MSFWSRIIGGGTTKSNEGGLPTGSLGNIVNRQEEEQENIKNDDQSSSAIPAIPKDATLPPPTTTTKVATRVITATHQLSSEQKNPPPSGPPMSTSSYYSPGNQKRTTTATITARAPPVIPIQPLSHHRDEGPPLGIHIFNPVISATPGQEKSEITVNKNDSKNDEQYNGANDVIMNQDVVEKVAPSTNSPSSKDNDEGKQTEESLCNDATQLDSQEVVAGTVDDSLSPTVPSTSTTVVEQHPETIASNHSSHPITQGQPKVPALPHPESSPSTSTLEPATAIVSYQKKSVTDNHHATNSTNELVVFNQHETQQLALYTPKSNSRFVFVSDEKTVPSELKKLGKATMRRRQLFQTRVHELECHLASLTAKLAHETMDREAALSDILPTHVYQPLEVVAERLLVEQSLARRPLILTTPARNIDQELANTENAESPSNKAIHEVKRPSLMDLEQRLSKLDTQMTIHTQQTMFDAKREKLEAVLDQLLHELAPELYLEASKADKREGSMNRRWESLAGVLARRYREESTTRKAAMAWVQEELQGVLQQQQAEDVVVLSKLQELRGRLEQERVARMEEDQRIFDLIAERAITLQRVLLEALADPVI